MEVLSGWVRIANWVGCVGQEKKIIFIYAETWHPDQYGYGEFIQSVDFCIALR
jgi:hypothetical protein